METSFFDAGLAQTELTLPMVPECAEYLEPHWYAAYTCANHEKRVAEQLGRRAVEHFLPLYQSVRKWKDRRIRLEVPLFPGYIFVRLPVEERLRVLGIPSVVRLVGFGGLACALPDPEIEALRNMSGCGLRAEPYTYPGVGRRVRVIRGPLEGVEGTLIRRKGRVRLVVSIDLLRQSAVVEVDTTDVEPINALALAR
jgi:transcription antitermination factor NusG